MSKLVQSVQRACDLLALLGSSRNPLSLEETAARIGLNKITTYRLLATLEERGLVDHVARVGYRASGWMPVRKRFRIGYASQSSEFAFSRAVALSLAQAAQAANIELLTVDNRYSRAIALKNAERFVREGVDLVIEFQTVAEIAPVLALKYHAAGIPVIAVEIPHPGATYYGADNYRAGQIGGHYLGRWAAKHWQGEVDEVILVELHLAGALPQSRVTGMLDGIRGVLGTLDRTPVVRLNGNGQYEATLHAMRKHLRSSRARRVLVGAVNDPSALGTLRAFEEAGRKQDCAVMAQNASEEAREELRREGTRLMGSVAYFPERYGPEIIALALDILDRKPVPPAVFTRHKLVTPANVDQMYPNDLRMVP